MSVRPSTDPANVAEVPKPVHERPIGRRTLLRAAIITVPVVAAFARNASAATDAHGCRTPEHYWCSSCSKCLKVACTECNNGSKSDCNRPECQQAAAAPLRASLQGDNTFGNSPFQQGQSAITDGGFNSSPWQ